MSTTFTRYSVRRMKNRISDGEVVLVEVTPLATDQFGPTYSVRVRRPHGLEPVGDLGRDSTRRLWTGTTMTGVVYDASLTAAAEKLCRLSYAGRYEVRVDVR